MSTNLSLFHCQTKDSNAHAMCAHGRQTMVKETNETTNFLACFFYNVFLYWLMNLFICITFLYQQDFFRWVKEANETIELQACFFHNTSLYWKTIYRFNFSLWVSRFLIVTNELVCLNMYCVCSIDNWLCVPISVDCWITL